MLNERDRHSLRMAYMLGVGDTLNGGRPLSADAPVYLPKAFLVELEDASLCFVDSNAEDLALQLMGEDGDADAHRFAYIQGIAALTSLMERAGLFHPKRVECHFPAH